MNDPQPKQGTHFWFLSLMQSTPGLGTSTHHRAGTITPRKHATRFELFSELLTHVNENWPSLAGAAVIAFDIQPNKL